MTGNYPTNLITELQLKGRIKPMSVTRPAGTSSGGASIGVVAITHAGEGACHALVGAADGAAEAIGLGPVDPVGVGWLEVVDPDVQVETVVEIVGYDSHILTHFPCILMRFPGFLRRGDMQPTVDERGRPRRLSKSLPQTRRRIR
jgi:hypothetical protein